jgi:hypothetical protein
MAQGDKYISWKEETANKAYVNLVYAEADNLNPADKATIAGGVDTDGAALVLTANWNPPVATSFFVKRAWVDPTTEANDEITTVNWEDQGKALSYATFRTLFTAQEKVDIDTQAGLTAPDDAQCVSYIEDLKSFETDSCLCLDKTEVDTIVNWFETKGLVGAGRAATILSGTLPV